MCAGQVQWQNGIVERHINAFQEVLDKRKDVEDNISISLSIFLANPQSHLIMVMALC